MQTAKFSLSKPAPLRAWGRAMSVVDIGPLNYERCSAWTVLEKSQSGGRERHRYRQGGGLPRSWGFLRTGCTLWRIPWGCGRKPAGRSSSSYRSWWYCESIYLIAAEWRAVGIPKIVAVALYPCVRTSGVGEQDWGNPIGRPRQVCRGGALKRSKI